MKQIEWGTAGITDSEGRLDRPLESPFWLIPVDIHLSKQALVWEWDTSRLDSLSGPRYSGWRVDMLSSFLRLATAPPGQIEHYARQWGVLGICEHSLPAGHAAFPSEGPIGRKEWCHPMGYGDGWFYEPLEAWRRFSREALALLNVAAMLHHGRPGASEDWAVIYARAEKTEHRWWEGSKKRWLSFERAELVKKINEWLAMGNVRPSFGWHGPGSVTSIHLAAAEPAHGLFGALAVQLMLAVARSDGLAICSACGSSYFPRRRPSAGRRHYCENCGRGAAVRHASATYRRRRKARESHTTARGEEDA